MAFNLTLKAQEYSYQEVISSNRGSVYSPVFFGQNIVYCSNQENKTSRKVFDSFGETMINLYITDTIDFKENQPFDKTFSSDFHDGPITFTYDQKTAVFSRNTNDALVKKGSLKDRNHLSLYESHFINGAWTEPIQILNEDTEVNNTHPTLNKEGNILIYSSNKPGGFGGFDLWKSEKINGTWTESINLGQEINSELDEVFPSICDNELYFASPRGAVGGLDIYKTCLHSICKVDCLPEPLNSPNDDFGLITSNSLLSGYFSSNRNLEDKIYSFQYEFPEFNECDTLVQDNFCYTLYDENAYELDNTGPLVYRWKINDVVKRGVEIDYCFPGAGEYEISIDIIDTILNIVYAEQDYYILNIDYTEQPYISIPDTVQVNETFQLSSENTYLPGINIIQEYWTISNGNSFIGKTNQYAFSAPGTFEVQLGMIGVNEYDTVHFCTTKKIVSKELFIVENKQLPKKELSNLTSNFEILESKTVHKENDTLNTFYSIEISSSKELNKLDDTLYLNYTDVFQINKTYNTQDSTFVYHVGEWSEIENAHPAWRELLIDGFESPQIISYPESSPDRILLDQKFTLRNLVFENNKWDILPEGFSALKEVIMIMQQHPDFMLEIGAYTDSIGNNQDNLILSQKRATSVYNYLIENGIPHDALIKKGYGENFPVAPNSTEEGRLMNRRVEFKIITN